MPADHHPFVIKTTITIADIEPPIWRRILLPRELNFAQLHEVIQAAFGWTDSHLHHFVVGGLVVGAPEFDEDELSNRKILEATEIALRDLDFYHLPHPRILYEYDFGDSWLHWIEFDPQMPSEDGIKYPICIDGARHRPPEDVGGPRGYADFLKAWCDPTHEEHRAMQTWAGRSFDPEAFDIAKTNKAIAAALRRCRGDYRFRRAR
jgi:Fe-S-cluster formation regulator IscX/YfhJ